MARNKILKFTLAVALVFGVCGVVGCNKDSDGDNLNNKYVIYQLAVEAGYKGTYDQWLASLESDSNKSSWFTGEGVPSSSKGLDGDFYFDSTSKKIYKKDNNTWKVMIDVNSKGILDIVKTTEGNIDIYTIRYTDGTNYSFNVKNGKDVKDLEFRVSEGYLQWSYLGENQWKNVAELNVLKGTAPTFEVIDGVLKWKYAYESSWKDLIDLDGLKGEDGTKWLVGEGVPTVSANTGDFYFDKLNDRIYLLTSSGWSLEVDLSIKDGVNVDNGLFTGRINGSEFKIRMTDGVVSLFNIDGVSNDDIFNVSVTCVDDKIVISAEIDNGIERESIEETFVLKDNNRLVKYIDVDELGLLKGVYYNSNKEEPLTLSDNKFVYVYNGNYVIGYWEVYDVRSVDGRLEYELYLDGDCIDSKVTVSCYDRSYSVLKADIDFTSKEYTYNNKKVALKYAAENNQYYLEFAEGYYYFANLRKISGRDELLCAETYNGSYILNYFDGTMTEISVVNKVFMGKTITVRNNKENVSYYYDSSKESFVPFVDVISGEIRDYILEYSRLDNIVKIKSKADNKVIFKQNYDAFVKESNVYSEYSDDYYVINITFFSDLRLNSFNVREIGYIECDTEQSFIAALNNGHKYIKITNDFSVSEEVVISGGDHVIDLNGHTISSGQEYSDDAIIRVLEHDSKETTLKIVNGYIGDRNVGTIRMSSSDERNLSKVGVIVQSGRNVSVEIDDAYIIGKEVGLTTIPSDSGAGGNLKISDSHIYSKSGDSSVGAGAYLSTHMTYSFDNVKFEGATGLYMKGGNVTLNNCNLIGNGEKLESEYNESWFKSTGAAFVVDNSYGHSDLLNVVINGGRFVSENSYPVEQVVTAPDGVEVEVNCNITGTDTATLRSEKYGVSDEVVTNNMAYVVNEKELREAIEIGKENIVLKATISVQNTVKITKGKYVIDLNGYIINSGVEYLTGEVLLIMDEDDGVDADIDVTIKNGYIGNYILIGRKIELNRTSGSSGVISRLGLSVNGGNSTKVLIQNVKAAGYETGFITNGLSAFKGAEIVVQDSEFVSSMTKTDDGAGAYLAGYANYTFNNVKFEGATGIYAKSGEIKLNDCTVIARGDKLDPVYYGRGYWPTGSALVVDSAYIYQRPLNVVLNGGSYSSLNNYAIEEIVTAPEGVDGNDYATVTGEDTITTTGEIKLIK